MSVSAMTVADIRALLGMPGEEIGTVPGKATGKAFLRLAGYADADRESIVFAQGSAELAEALKSDAGLILVPRDAALDAAQVSPAVNERMMAVDHPKLAFALVGQWFERFRQADLHATATIATDVALGKNTSVGAGAVIEDGAVLGEGCVIASNVTIYGCVRLGDRVLVQAGAVLGAMGFGYVRRQDGSHVRFPQQGTVRIGSDVEIGANTTIDRGALGETVIGDGTKIDNLVHIGHNCVVGKNVLIAAQVGISGSTVIGDGAVLAGQVGLGDHVTIGPGVVLGGQGGVFPGKTLAGSGELFAGTPAEPVKDYLRGLARVRRLK